jgi:hypothetical protein
MKDPATLKQKWVNAMLEGVSSLGFSLAVDKAKMVFPYYGDTLLALIGDDPENAPKIRLKGSRDRSAKERQFAEAVIGEVATSLGLNEADIRKNYDPTVTAKGFLNWPWVLATLRAIDSRGGGALALELFVHDVYSYLYEPSVRNAIHEGLRFAFDTRPTVVVAHSLGTIVAYNLLRTEGQARGWKVSTFITVGSPLSIAAVARALIPIEFPGCVETWRTARDPLDTVALHPLSPPNFPQFQIEAKNTVENKSANHHGIESYLKDSTVARWIYEALTDNR